MVGKRVLPASILLLAVALALLVIGPPSEVKAHNWDLTYQLILSSDTPGANANVTTVFTNPTTTNNNFSKILSATGYPEANLAIDSQIVDGTSVGSISNATTLSIFGGPCSTPITVDIPFMDCTTDVLKTAPWVGSGDNLVQDNDGDMNEDGSSASQGTGNCIDGIDNDGDGDADGVDTDGDTTIEDAECNNEATDTNGLPTYCDHYPSFLNQQFNNVRPRARYMGHQVVVDDAPATMLDFVIFNPEALFGVPNIEGQLGDTYGFIDFVVLDNSIAPVSPSTITDFCAPLTAIPTLLGVTDGSYTVTPGPEPYEVDRIGQCGDASDNDGDGWVDDGCLVFNGGVGAGQTRSVNPAPQTGLYGSGTHVVRTYSQSQRDQDIDGVSNNLDSCPTIVNNNVDADNDGLDSACDPDDSTPSTGAPAPNGVDDDSDTLTDEDPVDNADNDGDTSVDEDGECPATSGIPDEDQDCYTNRQDICPLHVDNQSDTDTVPGLAAADLGPPLDAIGDGCEAAYGTNPVLPEGHFHTGLVNTYACIPDPNGSDDTDTDGDSDDDDDGVCDSTEVALGSDKDDGNSVPEYIGLDLIAGTGTAAQAPGTCSDFGVYNHPDAPAIDNDGVNGANAADPNCATIAGDADDDGVPDGSDNCPAEKNPEQVNSDGAADGGDECDTDDDDDTISDANENCMGTDPKDDSSDTVALKDSANPFDFDDNQVVDVTDALTFLAKFPSAVTNPGDQRFDYTCAAADDVVDVTDALTFLAKFPSTTIPSITVTNDSGSTASQVDIRFQVNITDFKSASGEGSWTNNTALPAYDIQLTKDSGSISAGGTLTISLVGLRHPDPISVTWTP